MPTIDVSLSDLCGLVGTKLAAADVERYLTLVKGERKRGSTAEELRVELQDTNRPDLWCVEGIARQIRLWFAREQDWRAEYGFFESPGALAGTIEVDASVESVRPYVAGFVARGWKVDDAGLRAFIQTQETLCRNFGRKRATVAIGVYDGARLRFPVRYEAVPRESRTRAFVPLPPTDLPAGIAPARWKEPWTPAEILRDHPTGREYAGALPGDRAPILVDASNVVLSFPPIINSATLGRVEPGMDDLFVEVTGTVLDHVLLTANILAANLRDRGAAIHPVATVYPFETPRGREVTAPHPLPEKRLLSVGLERFRTVLGEAALGADDVRASLRAYGLAVEDERGGVRVEAPPWRSDYLNEVDAVEDFAISRGYASFTPQMPEEFTVGRLASSTDLADRARDRLIGYGFEEAITNILTEERFLRAAMNLPEEASGASSFPGAQMVRIANVMNASYACLRDWLLPSLLEVESHSAGAVYPHRIFEAGEVAVADPSAPLRSRTEQRVAGLVAHELASFTEAQAYLNLLLRHLGATQHSLVPAEHPTFLPGRFAFVHLPGAPAPVGVVGELHPEVLAGEQGFGIRVPCSAFELALAPFGAAAGASRRSS